MENLHPKSIWLFFISSLLRGLVLFIFLGFWGLPFLGALFGIFQGESSSIGSYLGGLLVLWLILFGLYVISCWVWANLSYQNWKYEFTEDAFRKESGVIWKSYVSIPYERIQNVDIYRGLFARILGLSDLQIQTAGNSAVFSGRGRMSGVGAEGRLPGLGADVANAVRDELIKRSKSHRPSL